MPKFFNLLSARDNLLPLIKNKYPKAFQFMQQFNLLLPIIQAPMAGADNNNLAINISKYGALGSRGMGYITQQGIAAEIRQLKESCKFFNLNLFIPTKTVPHIETNELKHKITHLKNYLVNNIDDIELNLDDVVIFDPIQRFNEQMKVVLDKSVPILSTTFGALPISLIKKCRQKNIFLIGTATTVEEGKYFHSLGYNAVITQGLEAGGHRGGMQAHHLQGQMDTLSLTVAMAKNIDIPIIASGGIRDSNKIIACLDAGASAVQIGTAFLACTDCSAIPSAYQQFLFERNISNDITLAISGRNARGMQNKLYRIMNQYYNNYPDHRLPYPFPHLITAPLRKTAARQNNKEYLAVWSGKSEIALRAVSMELLLEEFNLGMIEGLTKRPKNLSQRNIT